MLKDLLMLLPIQINLYLTAYLDTLIDDLSHS